MFNSVRTGADAPHCEGPPFWPGRGSLVLLAEVSGPKISGKDIFKPNSEISRISLL